MGEVLLCTRCMRVSPTKRCPRCGGEALPPYPVRGALPGETILAGKYLLGGAVGGGGFGITYRALDLRQKDAKAALVAIKEFFPRDIVARRPDLSVELRGGSRQSFEKWRENFIREYALLHKVSGCRAVARVREIFRENDTAYLVMDFIEGKNLERCVREGGPISPTKLMERFRDFIPALAEMHAAGVLHRDVNPANIMLPPEGCPKLIDFGSARPDPRGEGARLTVVVRRGYAPPEQYSPGGQGPWTDVYGLCATMYYAVTGVEPPDARSRQLEDELKPLGQLCPAAPEHFVSAVMRGLSLKPGDRQSGFSELARELYPEATPAPRPQPINPPSYAPPTPPRPAPQSPPVAPPRPAPQAPQSADGDEGDRLLQRRLEAAERAAKALRELNREKYDLILSRLNLIHKLESPLEKWVRTERILKDSGKFFSLVMILCARK